MPLAAGTRLGRYEVRAQIGAGGMGEVYRARDSRLGRDVAIKILPARFSADADRLRRFEQEAQAAGALNHPNILAIYDVDTNDGAPYVVSELLQGDTLRDRLHSPLPQTKAQDYALQIARGLAAAHDRGIVHRDIKPENIVITSDERVKILDFGLAKLTAFDADEDQTDVPTRKIHTNPGAVIGTVGYMAPEQVQGLSADHRADIFSFGAVLYEMLSGRRPFHGDSAVETMNAILNRDPIELSQAGVDIAPSLERIVRRCLQKKPSERFQSTSDLGFALEAFSGVPGSKSAQVDLLSPWLRDRKRFGWITAAVLLLLLLSLLPFAVGYFRRPPAENMAAVRFTVPPPEKTEFIKLDDYHYSTAVSPDGRQLALVARGDGQTQLWMRQLNELSTEPVEGTKGALNPFWSPDGRFVAFFADGKLKKVDPAGGPPQTICSAPIGSGTWNGDGVILFNKAFEGIYRVAASGGEPMQVTKPDPARQEIVHFWPHFLPDGRHFLYLAGHKPRDSQIYIGTLDSGEATPLLQANSRAIYAPPGYLLYVRDASLLAQPFDLKTRQLSGDPLPVAEGLIYFNPTGDAEFSVSNNGVLAFKAGAIVSRLVWFNRSGAELESVGDPGNHRRLRLSPDGQRLAVDLDDPRTGTSDIWVYDLARDTSTRVTFDIEQELGAIWSPDGREIVFGKDKEGPPHLFLRDLHRDDEEQLLPVSGGVQYPDDWSPDKRHLIYEDQDAATGQDLWLLPMTGERKPSALLRTRFDEWDARFSPDGLWVAYVSNESGRPEVYLRPFKDSSRRWQISNSGGRAPRWRRDGKELFYVATDGRMMAVPLKAGATFEAGSPVMLFRVTMENSTFYDVTSDGQRFLVNTNAGAPPLQITVVVNWTENLKR